MAKLTKARIKNLKQKLETKKKKLISNDGLVYLAREKESDPSDEAVREHDNLLTATQMNGNVAVLNKINVALEKIQHNHYGVCEECGKNIPLKRLEAVPWACFCLRCQEELENTD